MGLSFHYKGRIRNQSMIHPLTEEVKDICESMGWKYRVWNKETSADNTVKIDKETDIQYTPEDLSGISISPDNCEPLFLTFLPDCNLCSFISWMAQDAYPDKEMLYWVSTKTQFAGLDTHISLLKLLRYLQQKYFAELEVQDEGLYWDTQDEKKLFTQFLKYNDALKMVEKALSDFKAIPPLAGQSLANRIEALLINRLGCDKENL